MIDCQLQVPTTPLIHCWSLAPAILTSLHQAFTFIFEAREVTIYQDLFSFSLHDSQIHPRSSRIFWPSSAYAMVYSPYSHQAAS